MTSIRDTETVADAFAVARKAVTAGAVGLAGALGAAMLDGNLTGPEAIVSAGMGLLAAVATYKVPNAD